MNLKQKYADIKKKIKEMDTLELCRIILLAAIRLELVIYLIAIAGVLPLFYIEEMGYYSIGSNKAVFFQEWGFMAAEIIGKLAILYVFVKLLMVVSAKHKECQSSGCKFSTHVKSGMRNFPKKVGMAISRVLDKLSVTDKFALLYTIGLLLSYCFTEYKDWAKLGATGWFMGLLPQLVFVGSYFAISRFLPKRLGKWTVGMMLMSSFAVFLLGILNRYGFDPLGMSIGDTTFISTIGNINWFCGYWAVLSPLAMALYWLCEKKPNERNEILALKRVLLGLFTVVGFVACVTQGSDSGVMTCAAMILLMGCLSTKDVQRLKRFFEMIIMFWMSLLGLAVVRHFLPKQNNLNNPMFLWLTDSLLVWVAGAIVLMIYLILKNQKWQKKIANTFGVMWKVAMVLLGMTLMSFVVALVVNTLHPGSLGKLSDNALFTFDRGWGSDRGGTWTAGVRTWASQDGLHKLVGVGPDCMAAYIYDGKDVDLLETVRAQFGTSRLTNAHGEWITNLANLGLIGFVAFAGMMLSAMVRFLKADKKVGKYAIFCVACGVMLFCYTINNTFSFQQIVNVTQMFVVLGLGECFLRKESKMSLSESGNGESND